MAVRNDTGPSERRGHALRRGAWALSGLSGLSGLAALTLVAPASNARAADAIRIVAADAPVQSAKRGVDANYLNAADFTALAPGVSWWYNWYYQPNQPIPANSGMQFVPEVWGGSPDEINGLQAYLAAGNRPSQILVLNEPNLKGQAFLTPQDAANTYQAVKTIADHYGIPVSAPQMAVGSASNASITAYDPIQHKTITYTSMTDYVAAFDYYAGTPDGSGIGIHDYGDINEFKYFVSSSSGWFNRPLDVTEFAWWGAPTPQDELQYMVQAVDYMERTPQVQSYAWFKERNGGNDLTSLLGANPGELTALGQAYITMPVHEANLYYRAAGALQAERYVTMNGAEIFLTTDGGGFTDMVAQQRNATLDYNIAVDEAGLHGLDVRVAGGTGTIRIYEGSVLLASFTPDGTEWQTLHTDISLPAGTQTLRVVLGSNGERINWLTFSAPAPEPASLALLAGAGAMLLGRRRGWAKER